MTIPSPEYELAAFRAAHPDVKSVDAFLIDINGKAFGKRHPAADLESIVRGIFSLKPADFITELGLKTPNGWSYSQAAAYGHFGRDIFPWEKTDKVEALKAAAGI